MFKLDLQKSEETDQIANIHQILENAREFQKNICYTKYAKAFDCVYHNKLEHSSRPPYQTTVPAFRDTCMQVKKQH